VHVKSVLSKTLLCLAMSATALAIAPAAAADAKPGAARIYIDTLDMSSPQAGADSFLKAFARSDYFAVQKLLSPEAQHGFTRAIYVFDPQQLLPRMEVTSLPGSTFYGAKSAEDAAEVGLDAGLMFDDIMMAAQRLYILPFTVGANAKVGKVNLRGKEATVAIINDGQPTALTLQMMQAPSGRWKIDRIEWAGSSTEQRPWGAPTTVPTEAAELKPTPPAPRTYVDTLDAKTPEAGATTFVKAFARADFFGVHQMLSPSAQRGFAEGLYSYDEVKLLPRLKDDVLPGSVLFNRKEDLSELLNDPGLLFDDVMFAAQRQKILPFTLGPTAHLGKVDTKGKAASVAVVTDGKPAAVTLQMALLPSGRWKVDRVVWTGSSSENRPWGAKE
jgi:hypothetical protein